MGDYGAIVSRKGFEVKTCADRFLVYSSAFPTLKVFNVSSGSTTIPTSGTNTITITHNLGYFAPYLIVYNGSTTTGVGTSNLMSDNDSYLNTRQYTNKLEILVDAYFDQYESSQGDTVYFTIYLFLDKLETYSAPTINTGTSSGSSSTDYGFRVSKAGFDVKTCADIDCVVSSSFFTNLVHRKGLLTGSSFYHGLGYVPSYFVYEYNATGGYIQTDNLALQNIQYIDSNHLYYDSGVGTGDGIYYLILKNTS